MEDAELILWPIGIVLMLAGGALLAWTHRSRRSVLEQLGPSPAEGLRPAGGCPSPDGRGPYALSRHPALLGVTLWLCGFALTCELWWMGLAVWFVVPGGLWLAMEYTEARHWLRHGHAYDLYAEATPLFLPTAEALRSLWWQAASGVLPRVLAAPADPVGLGRAPGARAGVWSAVGIRALFVTAAGAALALLKELSVS
jgi:hypothetical protein